MSIQDRLENIDVIVGIRGMQIVVGVTIDNKDIVFMPKIDILVKTSQRGVHMSRLIESSLIGWLKTEKDKKIENLGLNILNYLLKRRKLIGINPEYLKVHCEGEYIYELTETCTVIIDTEKKNDEIINKVGVRVKCLSVCPCALEESGGRYSHSQGVTVTVMKKDGNILELLKLVEKHVTPTRTLLKRDEEVELIRKAYENPLFVEDIVRKLAEYVDYVEAVSDESIHKHQAIAMAMK
jgi:GTP cyclohydrolase FolE2